MGRKTRHKPSQEDEYDAFCRKQWLAPRGLHSITVKTTRTQLRALFIGSVQPGRGRMSQCFTSLLPELDLDSTPLVWSLDALSFREMTPEPDNATHEADTLHTLALSAVRYDLESRTPTRGTPNRNLQTLIAIMLLAMYDDRLVGDAALQECVPWAMHLTAAAQYLQVVGPAGFNLADPVAANVLLSLLTINIKTSVFRRRGMELDACTLQSLCCAVGSTLGLPGPLLRWFSITSALPTLLEQADRHVANTHGLIEVLSGLRQSLISEWMPSNMAPKAREISQENLVIEIEEHFFLSVNPLFKQQFHFASLLEGKICLLTWLFALLADCAALRQPHIPKPAKTELLQSAYRLAVNLCQCVHHLSQFETSMYIHTTGAVVDIAAAFFTEIGALRELGWHAVAASAGVSVEITLSGW
ncbi:hypothetical protein PRZ48_009062 [Zasmidium cellare]|uniref:Uncharacterized protein n=1 Tax=Zasmidium cellare TaxID=395010 RepID=A0ABR0EH95_ZASCE|nr:hypothetical protein PRZ48_009062 [Zasmidium cellare]